MASDAVSPLLAVSGLNAWYGGAHVLHDVALHVARGEVVALMGRNGAGKSTTLKSIMAMGPRRTGDIDFMGAPVLGRQAYEIARRGLGYVPEDRRVFTELTVSENLATGRQPPRIWPEGDPAPAWTEEDIYALFPALLPLRGRRAGSMSGGEQQMLAVARTLVGNPYLILLDEPSEGVAPLVIEQMAEMIVSLKQRGTSILLCEQNFHFAQWVSDRAYVLEKGVVRYSGSMEELAGAHEVRSAYLGL